MLALVFERIVKISGGDQRDMALMIVFANPLMDPLAVSEACV